MNHDPSRQVRSCFPKLVSVALLLAACSAEFDRDQFGPAPSAAGGVAGWVLNGEGGETAMLGGSAGRPAGVAGSSAAPRAGSPGIGGRVDGVAGTESGPVASGGSSGSGGSGGLVSGDAGGAGAPRTGDPHAGEGGSDGDVPPPKVHAFLLSEYVEGSSNNKAVEIYANEASTLDGCELRFFFNGGVDPASVALEGSLAAGQAYAVCTQELAVQIPPRCTRVASLRFNGNDAVSLACDGVVIDSFGQVGNDPGKAWGSGEATSVDHTLRRKCGAVADAIADDAFDLSLAWDAFPADDFGDLGRRVCEPDSGQAGAPGQGGDAGDAGESSGGAGHSGAASLDLGAD